MQRPDVSSLSLEVSCSPYFLSWLQEQQLSLALTTYQTNRLFLVGTKPDGQLSTFERYFERAMGLYGSSERLYLSTRYQLWQLDNVLQTGEQYRGYDKLYVPRIGYTTGDLNIHDVAVSGERQQVVFVNTAYSCLATLSDRHSFTPLWQPSFISKLAPEDRCHLNGVAMADGKPRYVTAISRSDVASGWRERRQDGGVVVDVETNEVVLSGLSMPHSPRVYQNRLWLLNSGTGEFGYLDEQFVPVAFCPGFLRGLAFHHNFAIVGLSKPRDRHFTGLALDERLAAKDAVPRCGLMVIDLTTGNIAHWLQMEGVVKELFDVVVLPGVRLPTALGFKTDEICQVVTFEQSGGGSQVVPATPPPPQPSAQPRLLFRQGKALTAQGNLAAAVTAFQEAIRSAPDYLAAYNQLGNVLQAQGRVEEAIAAYQQGLAVNPNVAALQCNLGNAWQMQGQVEEAITAYQRAIELDSTFALAYFNLGQLLAAQHQPDAAEHHFQQALRHQPHAAEIYLQYGNLLQQQGRTEEAIAQFREAIGRQPSAEAYVSLGTALQSQQAFELAQSCYQRALQLKPDLAAAHFKLGLLQDYQNDLEAARASYEQALSLSPQATDVVYYLSNLYLKLGDWEDYEARTQALIQATHTHLSSNASTALPPLTLNYFPVPLSLHAAVARQRATLITRLMAATQANCLFQDAPVLSDGKIRLGYLSPDFREHAVGILIGDLFPHHDRDRFEVYAYSLLASDDAIAQKIQGRCDRFIDLSSHSPVAAARQIHRDCVQILIDLAGYTTYSRPEILALQPAPVQCLYLGYPDTMGAAFVQYLIADRWVAPPEIASTYTEKVIYLPHQFMASELEIAPPLTRPEVGLPQEAFVFCCFNAHHKIEPTVFTSWMNILKQVPGSVLWLSAGADPLMNNLRTQAEQRGVAASRLIFAPQLPLPQYLARCQLADLFLDTFSYSAGSTAVCALSAGLPLLTKLGETNASRMGASICAAAGLEAMICSSVPEYEQRAIELATQPHELAFLRHHLRDQKSSLPLFNPQQHVRHLEKAFLEMWQQYISTNNQQSTVNKKL
ncbi:MAG: TIGR03032 family protein [Cyanophyceae cyanobacterium]